MEEIKELVDKLNRYSYEYYTLDNPTISDKEYDKLYDKLLDLEKETGVILPNSPTQRVGGEILKGFKKVNHKNKLWSLDKAQSKYEVLEFTKRCESFIKEYNKTHNTKLPQPTYVVTKKYDGLTIKTDYEGINFKQASTRGNSVIGEDVTHTVKTTINLPKQLNDNSPLVTSASFHGEGLMTHKAMEEYNLNNTDPKKNIKNCRNGIAGALRNLDSSETAKKKPIIIFYNINDIDEIEFQTYEEQLKYMNYRGLPVTDYKVCNTYNDIIEEIDNIEKQRPNLPYDIDGVVIALNDLRTRELMGYTIKFPKYSIAYKYEAEETTSKLLSVDWNVGRTGRITPVANIEPVDLCGSTVSKATLNNIADIHKKGLKINADIFIHKSNDVIPEITGVVEDSITSDCIDISEPTECPICHGEVIKENDLLYCNNPNCNAKLIQSISHYCSRNAMNIEGLSEKTIEKFIEQGFIKNILDIYSLEQYKKQIIHLDGFGSKSYNNLINSINKSKECKLENFIFALGIPNVGLSTAKNIVEFAKEEDVEHTLANIECYYVNKWLKMRDCGQALANSIVNWFKNQDNYNLWYNLQDILTFIEEKPKEVKDGVLQGKEIYCTGTFKDLKKNDLKKLVIENGGIFANGYKKSLDYLVVGLVKGSSKEAKAKADEVKILQEDEFLNLLK